MEFVVSEQTVQIIGPFRGDIYYLVVNGCKVPYVHLYKRNDTDYDWALNVDRRFEADVNEDEIMRWGMCFANAMAVAAGYTYCGPDSAPMNRFSTRFNEL